MSVNLTARQFGQPGLIDVVRSLLATTGLEPASLELEITESVVMGETEAGIARLRAFATWACASCWTTSGSATRR